MRSMGLGRIGPALLLFTVLTAGSASAYDANDPHNCNGVHWDDKRALVVQKVTARPRVNFIKSPYDDDFKAETCPAATEACRKKSYLVTGDLVLTGKTQISRPKPARRRPRLAGRSPTSSPATSCSPARRWARSPASITNRRWRKNRFGPGAGCRARR